MTIRRRMDAIARQLTDAMLMPEGGVNLEGYIDALTRCSREWHASQSDIGNSF